MLPNGRVIRVILATLVIAAGALVVDHLSGTDATAVRSAEGRLESAEQERQTAAEHADAVGAQAVAARVATKPPLARAEALRARVRVVASGQLEVESSDPSEFVAVPVPPLVTDRLQADSVAISALSVALTWDANATAAQEQRLVAETKARDAASLTIAELEREKSPRCGRRCGFLLGAASVVALGIALR